MKTPLSRREVIRFSTTTAGGLIAALYLPWDDALARGAKRQEWRANAWLRISSDGVFTFVLDRAEMGQGVMTSLAMILAEELDLDPKRFVVETAPVSRRYVNRDLNLQITGGSTSVHAAWKPLREAGAATRARIVAAAAADWRVPVSACRTRDGVVYHDATGRSMTYASAATTAAKTETPRFSTKSPNDFVVVGRPQARLDTAAKIAGKATYGVDVRVPGQKFAFVIQAPKLGGKVSKFDGGKARKRPGVVGVYQITRGVAVVADEYWQAVTAAKLVEVSWDNGDGAKFSSAAFAERLNQVASGAEFVAVERGADVDELIEVASTRVTATYSVPFLAHATMEPQNCTARLARGRCDVWAPTQSPALASQAAAAAAGVEESRVTVHTTYLGGGFGRRLAQDYVVDAVETAKAAGVPVQVIWTREQDIQHSLYRPAASHVLSAALNVKGAADGLAPSNRESVDSHASRAGVGTGDGAVVVAEGDDSRRRARGRLVACRARRRSDVGRRRGRRLLRPAKFQSRL